MVFAEKINVNHHSVPQVNDELINSFKIFVMFIGSSMFQRKYYKKNLMEWVDLLMMSGLQKIKGRVTLKCVEFLKGDVTSASHPDLK